MRDELCQEHERAKPTPGRRCAAPLVALACLLGLAAGSFAREPAEQFVAALRDRGMYDLALDYLAQMETSRLADAEFKGRIPYHRGLTLIAKARQTPDVDQRAALFEQASRELQQFVADSPESPAAAESLLELATVLVDQSKQLLAQANQLPSGPAYAEQRGKLQKQARGLLAEAQPHFRQAEQFYDAALEKMPKALDPKTQHALIVRRQDYRGRLAQVSVLAGQAEFEAASTYPADSKEFSERNEAAAKTLADLAQTYSRWLVGFYARLYEGRCYQAVGDYQRALGSYEEIVSQSSVPPGFRKLIATAFGYQAQCLIAQGKLDEAIVNLTGWLDAAKGDEAHTPEWLFARFELAEALAPRPRRPTPRPAPAADCWPRRGKRTGPWRRRRTNIRPRPARPRWRWVPTIAPTATRSATSPPPIRPAKMR